MHEGHRPDAQLSFFEHPASAFVGDGAGLKAQEAGNDLHVVLDPVMDLPEEDLLFLQRHPQVVLDPDPVGDIADQSADAQAAAFEGHPEFPGFEDPPVRSLLADDDAAALALENARLFDETHQRALYLSLLNEITQTAIHSSNLNETMGLISQQMARLFNADGAYITLWDDQQQLSIPAAAYGVNQEGYKDIPAKPNERTLTLSVLELGQTLVVDDLQSTPYIEPQLARTYPFQTLIGLPLISDNQKLGAVILGIINNMLNMAGISPYLQGMVKGFVILLAVLVQYKRKS